MWKLRRVGLLGFCLSANLCAQTSGAPVEDEIVVRANAGNRKSIDSQTYLVKDTPLTQTKNAIEVIERLPSVSLDATGQLRLLGSTDVKILIDGRDIANTGVILQNLQASQIARVEVMTNLSARYSSYGAAGIINVILRRRFGDSLDGTANAGVGNPGSVTARISPSWSDGTWSFLASPSFSSSQSHSDGSLVRSGTDALPDTNRNEDNAERGNSRSLAAMGQVSYHPSMNERYGADVFFSDQNGETRRSSKISSPINGFAPYVETSNGHTSLASKSLSLDRAIDGTREGEEFKLGLSLSSFSTNANFAYSDRVEEGVRDVALYNGIRESMAGFNADYVLPLSKTSTLSLGAELQGERQSYRDAARGELSSGSVNTHDMFSGQWIDLSIYGTIQFELGTLTILPGLRVQDRRFRFDDASGLSSRSGTLFFPTLHVQRHFGKLTGSISITQRAEWPAIGLFMPYRRYTGPTTVDTGNSNLRPERTLGLEASAEVTIGRQELSFGIYNRRRQNVRDTTITVTDDGQLLSRPVSLGSRLSRGGQFSAHGKLSSKLRYSLSAWAADAVIDRLDGTSVVRDRVGEYGGNAELELLRGAEGTPGFGDLTIGLKYFGPTQDFQSRTDSIVAADLSYTHTLTPRLSAVATLNRAVGTRIITTERYGTNFDEISRARLYGPLFQFSLTYKLGKPASDATTNSSR